MYINFRSQNFYTFELYGHMYCYNYNVLPEAIFVVYWYTILFTFFGDLPAMNICLHAKFHVQRCYGFGSTALQKD